MNLGGGSRYQQEFITDKTSKMRQEGYSHSFAKYIVTALAAGCSWVNIDEVYDSEEILPHKEYFDYRDFNDLGQLCAYMANKTRASRAEKVFSAFDCATGKLEEVTIDHVADLITDLMHFCRFNGWSNKSAVNMALSNYHAEISAEELPDNRDCHGTAAILIPRKLEEQMVSGRFTMHQGIPDDIQRDSF